MQIKIDATESTNDYLKQLLRQGPVEDGSVVRTFDQTRGRGQRGAVWHFEKDKSLAISVLKKWSGVVKPNPLHLQWVVTYQVFKVLKQLGPAGWHIKWPNDIMADHKKIAGLLIEHQFQGSLQSTIIGIGVNVNNSEFFDLPYAGSIKQIVGHDTDLDQLAEQLATQVYAACDTLKVEDLSHDLAQFNQCLFLKDSPAWFMDENQNIFQGSIQRVDEKGQLLLQTSSGLQSFSVGELKLRLDLP